jgi:hypothetical protein
VLLPSQGEGASVAATSGIPACYRNPKTPLESPIRAATVLYCDRFAELFPSEAARLRSETGPVAADSYDQVRPKELEARLRRQLARARTNERA